MANTFQIKTVGILDTSKMQKALDAFEAKNKNVKFGMSGTTAGATSASNAIKALTTHTKSYKDELGRTISETTRFDASGKQISETTKHISENLNKATKVTKTFGEDFLDTTKKVLKFGAITAMIGAVTASISKGYESIKQLDDALVELRKVTDLSGNSLKTYTNQAYDLAEAMSTTASNVVDATTEFAKSGYSISDSIQLAESALKFQTIADGAVSASDSATLLIQTMKAYNMTAQDSEKIISSINQVSNNFAVSSSDLSGAIGKVASTAQLANVNFDQLLGLITASNTIVQQSGKVANGYKTILTNLITKDLEEQFNAFGLSMRDNNHALKDGYTILKELSGVYKSLGETWDGDTESMVSLNDQMNKLLEDIAGGHIG